MAVYDGLINPKTRTPASVSRGLRFLGAVIVVLAAADFVAENSCANFLQLLPKWRKPNKLFIAVPKEYRACAGV